MEQFFKNFFNNNTVCVGLCDLQRKVEKNDCQSVVIDYQQTALEKNLIQQQLEEIQKISKKQQTLAQYFLKQQQEYAMQQKAIQTQKQQPATKNIFEQQLNIQRNIQKQLQQENIQKLQKQAAQKQMQAQRQQAAQQVQKPQLKAVQQPQKKVVSAQQNVESYIKNANPKARTTTVIQGNMKKTISSAIPAKI